MDVFVVVYEDRHCDVEFELYEDEADALYAANTELNKERQRYGPGEIRDQLNETWTSAGCIWAFAYGEEGDGIRIMRKEVQ